MTTTAELCAADAKRRPKCVRCGVEYQGTGFRYHRRGLGVCDKCWPLGDTPWINGPSFFQHGPTVMSSYRPALSKAPHTCHV